MSLLYNHFRNQDAIRIHGGSPWKRSAMAPIPSNQSRAKPRALQLNLIHGQRVTSLTLPLTAVQAGKLRELLAEQGFEFISRPYMLFFAQKGKLSVAVY